MEKITTLKVLLTSIKTAFYTYINEYITNTLLHADSTNKGAFLVLASYLLTPHIDPIWQYC